ncbi:GntR family transcriptional regulator [Ancylobacter oerskovii]|uniref:GntR family transcriptional regulator n=1 Tax=Ancylobacter oerskovii TaxID=459519 RepID=A0ABW4YZX8_9HYPH|nr:GntR family transcriptional regulator [Ancylobacter oerskovii]MBS7543829.1 GntR family transcriptional regulator [Ancylobacter oerskovii]
MVDRTASEASTLGERVFEQMLDMIYRGDLAPGSVVNEAALAVRFQVSRGPIREAVRRLQGIQLVTREPFAKARVVKLSRQALADLYEMREALEGYACRLVTERMSDQDLAELIAALETARQDYLRDGQPESLSDFDFHSRIIRASGNARLISTLYGDLYHLLRMMRRIKGHVPQRKHDAYSEHWQIIRAIKARDADLAESLMRAHIRRAAAHTMDEGQLTDVASR